jgi:hypothetical protein
VEVSPKARTEIDRQAELEGRVLVLVGAWHARHGVGPTWAELREALGLDKPELEAVLFAARRRGLVTFKPARQGSTALTRAGRNAAMSWASFQRGRPR